MDKKVEDLKEEIKEELIDEVKKKEEEYLIKFSEIPKQGVPIRVIDIAKFNQYFGVPWENIMDDLVYIKNNIGFWLYFSFWAWRGWNFVKKKKPDEELTFSEWGSMFDVNQALDMYNLFHPEKKVPKEIKDELSKSS